MARRGKPSLSPEQKAAKKERAEADKAQALASNALAKLPAEKEKRDELWQELEALKSEAAGVSGSISAQKKRMSEVFGITKAAMKIRAILNSCKAGEYEATIEQVQLFMADTNRPFQMSMKLEPGKGVQEDGGSIFDKTSAGDHVAAERGDDPGRAHKSRSAPPPPVTTPDVGVEGLAAGIKPLASPEEKKAVRKGPPAPPAAAPSETTGGFGKPSAGTDGFDDGKDVRSPELIQKEQDRKAAESEAAMKDMSPSQRRAEAKRIANEVFAKQGNKGLGPDAVH